MLPFVLLLFQMHLRDIFYVPGPGVGTRVGFSWFLGSFLSTYFSSSDSTEQRIHFPPKQRSVVLCILILHVWLTFMLEAT